MSSHVISRVSGEEIRVDTRLNLINSGLGEALIDVTTPFTNWTSLNFSYVGRIDSADAAAWKCSVSKEGTTAQFVAKCKASPSHSLVDASLHYNDALVASVAGHYDRSDLSNQTMEVKCQIGDKIALLKGGFEQRDSNALSGGARWHALLITPLEGLAHTEGELKFDNAEGAQELALLVRKDAWLLQANGSCAFGQQRSRAALDVLLPASLAVRRLGAALDYRQMSPSDHLVVSSITCDDQVLETNVSLAASDGELAAFLETRSTRDGYGPLSARFNVAGTVRGEGKALLFELDGAGGRRFNLTAQLRAPSALRVDARLAASAASPSFGRSRFLDTALRYDLVGAEMPEGTWRRRFASLAMNVSARAYVLEGEVKTAADRLRANASIAVRLPLEDGMRAHAHYDARPRGALSAAASVATAAGRDLFQAALALNDSLLTAQVVSEPLGVRALTVAASWAPRAASPHFARLHLHLPERQLSVQATAARDLSACELQLSATGAGGGRLHAKYDASAPQRNLTAVVARGDDTLTLSATLARGDQGTRGDFYLSASRLGRVHVLARLRTPLGSQLDLFVDDRDFNRVLHTGLASTAKEVSVFTESQFRDLQKLNISIRFDVVPAFNHVGLDMEYIAEQTKFPAKLSAKIDRKSAIFKLQHFVYKFFPEDMETILTYDKLLDTPSNPSFVFVLSVNNTKIFRSSAHFVFDWEKEIQIDLKMNSQQRDKKWRLGVGCRCETKFPATVSLNVTDQTGALVAMDGRAVAAERGGFTYRLALSTDHGRQRREALVEYYPRNPLLMSVDTNATSGAETRRYFAALKMDVERALLRLDLATPVAGYENLTLHWRREDDSLALDAHTTYPGFERVGVRARFYLQEGPAKAASLYVERDGSTVGGALYLERVEGLLNVSCELELHGTGGGRSGLNFWYDVRGPLKSVEVKLLDTCVHRVAATFATEPGLELHAIADIKKQASSLDVSYNPKHVAFRGVVVGKTVADFNFQRVDSGNDTSVDAKFMSSFVAHPLKLRYDYNVLENPNPEIRMFMTVSALEKTSTVDFRMPADDSPNMSYNLKVDLPDGEWTAEVHIREEGSIEAKTSVVGYGAELLHAEMHESSPGVKALTVSVLDGQFVDAKLTFDFSGIKKFSDLHVLRDGSPILNAHLHAEVKEESVEVIGTADVPNFPLRGFAFNYTLGRGDVLRKEYPEIITDGAGVGHWLYFVWQTESDRMATDLHAVFGPQIVLDVSVKNGKTHLLLYNHKLYTLVKESVEKQLDMQLKLKELEWKLFGVSTFREHVSGIRLEATTPWSELQRLVFNFHRNDSFDLKLLATSHNKDAQITAKMTSQDGTFASAELSLPDRPKVAAVVSAKGGRSPALILEVTSGEQVLKAEAGAEVREGGRVEAQARLTTPWNIPWALEGTYDGGVAHVRTVHGTRTVAEAEGKLDFKYDQDVSFSLALEGAVLDRKARAAAGWSCPTQGGSGQRSAHLEWQSEGAIVKFRFDAEPESRGRKFGGTMAIVADSIVLHGSANGTWPKAAAVAVRTGGMQQAYEASYDFREDGHTTNGAVLLKTLVWEPLEVKVSLTDDKATGRREAVFSARGYRVFAFYNNNGISDTRFELSDSNGVILSLKNVLIGDTYNGEVAWRENSSPKKVEISLRMEQNGKFELTSPWDMYALANWNHVNKTNGQALLHWNGMDLNAEYDRSLPFSRVFLGSPWGAVHLRQVKGEEQGSIAFMVDDSTGDKQVLYAKYEYDDQMRFLLHVWREALHKVEVSLSPDLRRAYALVATPRLNVDAGVEARADGWGARLRTEGELAPAVDARLSSDDAHFAASAKLPGADLQAALTRHPVRPVASSFP
ncbi:Uncharacterized protein GBIM_12780, partial [Gryllus bimaculatus]